MFLLFFWAFFAMLMTAALAARPMPPLGAHNPLTVSNLHLMLEPYEHFCFYETLQIGDDCNILLRTMDNPNGVEFSLRGPDGTEIAAHSESTLINFDQLGQVVQQSGDHEFCIRNIRGANCNVISFLMILDVRMHEAGPPPNDTIGQVEKSLATVTRHLAEVVHSLSHRVGEDEHEVHLVASIDRSVQRWCICFSAAVLSSSLVQITFIRKMFSKTTKLGA